MLDSIESAIEDIKQGKLVIVVDDEDRENEGDFITAAQNITPRNPDRTLGCLNNLCITLIAWFYGVFSYSRLFWADARTWEGPQKTVHQTLLISRIGHLPAEPERAWLPAHAESQFPEAGRKRSCRC